MFISSFIIICLRLFLPGGICRIAAEYLALRRQLITVSRRYKRSPKLTVTDRLVFGALTSMINTKRLSRITITLKPTTLLKFHQILVKRKYHLLFSNKKTKKPGPKGPIQSLIAAIIKIKKRNPNYDYRRIAMQISSAFAIKIEKDVVRRVLSQHYKYTPDNNGPSWLNSSAI